MNIVEQRKDWCRQHLKKWHYDDSRSWGDARCPLHNDENASLGVNCETGGWKCLGCNRSGVLIDLAKEAGLPTEGIPVFSRKSEGGSGLKRVATYTYRDEEGKPLYRVNRYEPKTFRIQRFEGGEWLNGMGQSTRRVPYRWDECLSKRTLLWLEGEKDVDRAWTAGLPATTSATGASSFRQINPDDLRKIAGRQVLVIPDNDQPGLAYAEEVCTALCKAGAVAKIIHLPGVGEHGDFSDWIAQKEQIGKDTAELQRILSKFITVPAKQSEPEKAILLGGSAGRQLHHVTNEALEHLKAWNQPPVLFCDRNAYLSRLVPVEGEMVSQAINADALRGWLSEACKWKRGKKYVYPEPAVAKDIVLRHAGAFPLLEGVVRIPIFNADLELVDEPGYDEKSKLFLDLGDLRIPEVPKHPTASQVDLAKSKFLDFLLEGFPFEDDASRAHTMAAILLPFVRALTGPTPLHIIESPQVGNGKSLLASAISITANGKQASALPDCKDDEAEWRKKIQSLLRNTPTYINIDNVGSGLESDVLASVLTAEVYEDRELGTARSVRYLNRSVWMASGNNLALKVDIARRSLFIKIDSKTAKPWERNRPGFFRCNPLLPWAKENRNDLVWSALVLCQNWVANGAQRFSRKLIGSFEEHNRVMGGILEAAHIPGFLSNYDQQFAKADIVSNEWLAFMVQWWSEHQRSRGFTDPMSAGDISKMIEEHSLLESVIRRGKSGMAKSTGWAIRGQLDRLYPTDDATFKISLVVEGGKNLYQLHRLGPPIPDSPPEFEIDGQMVFS